MPTAIDATVVREPASGVHVAVQCELDALAQTGGLRDTLVFSTSSTVREIVEGGGGTPITPWEESPHPLKRIYWQQRLLPQELEARGADRFYAMAYTAPFFCPVPYALHLHDVIALDKPGLCSIPNLLHMQLLLARSIRNAKVCIVSTGHVADRVRDVVGIGMNAIRVAPLGVDYEWFAKVAPRPSCLPRDDVPYLLFVGNLEPKKGLMDLLHAIRALSEDTGVRLVLAGRPGWRCRPIVKLAGELEQEGKVVMLGRVRAGELPGLYQHATAFVFPSIEEGFGMPVLEAMASGTPVIHSDHPALREVAGMAGIEVPREAPQRLAAVITHVVEDDALRHDLSAAGRDWARHFSWETRARAVADTLSGL